MRLFVGDFQTLWGIGFIGTSFLMLRPFFTGKLSDAKRGQEKKPIFSITVSKNDKKSCIQHCEGSELRLHFEWTKVS